MDASVFSDRVEIDVRKGTCKVKGAEYPSVGFGTYRLTGEICTRAVIQAATVGYRIIDTATYYKNFDGIAEAMKSLNRSDFYIISKVWHDSHSKKDLRRDLEQTLNALQTGYLDAYLLHWPNSKIPIEETLNTMTEFVKDKKIRHIGMSNVSVNHLIRALEVGVPITWVQVEMHPFFYDKKLLDFCKKHSIATQAWRPLDLGRTTEDQILREMGVKYKKTACQIALRWIIQHGCIPLPGSKTTTHIQENFDVMNFTLSEQEMQSLNQRALTGARFRLDEERAIGFLDEFDFSYEECWPKG
jgi:diketogulonate reductase-like aldo/keto reductase